MRSRREHLQSPSAPTQPTYTHLSHTAPSTNSNGTCNLTQEKHNPYFSMRLPHKSLILAVTHAHTHMDTHTHGCVTSCRDRTATMRLALSGFAETESRALPSQADVPPPPRSHKYPLWVLYGPILFSPTQSPRGGMATFSCLFNDCG